MALLTQEGAKKLASMILRVCCEESSCGSLRLHTQGVYGAPVPLLSDTACLLLGLSSENADAVAKAMTFSTVQSVFGDSFANHRSSTKVLSKKYQFNYAKRTDLDSESGLQLRMCSASRATTRSTIDSLDLCKLSEVAVWNLNFVQAGVCAADHAWHATSLSTLADAAGWRGGLNGFLEQMRKCFKSKASFAPDVNTSVEFKRNMEVVRSSFLTGDEQQQRWAQRAKGMPSRDRCFRGQLA